MRILIAAVAVAMLAGCGTTPIPSSQADRVPAARLKAFQDPKAGSAVMVEPVIRVCLQAADATRQF